MQQKHRLNWHSSRDYDYLPVINVSVATKTKKVPSKKNKASAEKLSSNNQDKLKFAQWLDSQEKRRKF